MALKVLVPMAGQGDRFVQDGYTDPKPLIPIRAPGGGKKMIIEFVLEMFPKGDVIFIVNDRHAAETDMLKKLAALRPDAAVVTIPAHKKGPVWTVLPALPLIGDDDEVIISYCDGYVRWDLDAFLADVRRRQLDGCWVTHTGFSPHTLNSTKMAFMRHDDDGLMLECKEKESYTDNPLREHASSGVYYFRRGADVARYFVEAVEKNVGYRGEFYVTLVYNLLVRDCLRVGYYDAPTAILGTPQEVRNFEAWSVILERSQVKDESDLADCYYFWRHFHHRV